MESVNIYISLNKLRGILQTLPAYLQHVTIPKSKNNFRSFDNIQASRSLFIIDYLEIIHSAGANAQLYKKARALDVSKKHYLHPHVYTGLYLILDVFSRKIWYILAKDERAETFIDGFERLFPENEQSCDEILVDGGTQFSAKKTQKMLKSRNIITKIHGGGSYQVRQKAMSNNVFFHHLFLFTTGIAHSGFLY